MASTPVIQSIYTDGACTGNPGPGGWGVVVYFNNGAIHEMGDACSQTTNNRMEMQAAIAALKYLQASKQDEPITLYTDSEYLINCVTKWVKGWKKKNWKKADGQPVSNQDLLEILDGLNNKQVKWQHVRGHAGNIGNERCDTIARCFAAGRTPSLQKCSFGQDSSLSISSINEENVSKVSENLRHSTIINNEKQVIDTLVSNQQDSQEDKDNNIMEQFSAPAPPGMDELPREARVAQLRNLVETLRIADEIAEKGYLITSSELADLMDVHASAVTSRGDEWRWRNWIVSRVRREGNQILWELERGDRPEEES